MYDQLFNTAARASANAVLSAEFKALLRIVRNADPYGFDPHLAPPPGWPPYKPTYVALLYIRLERDWRMVVNHACYAMASGNSGQERLNKAKAVFTDKLEKSAALGRDVQLGDVELRNHKPFKHAEDYHPDLNREYDSASFEDFKFLSQNELFIFIDHPNASIELVDGNLVGFSAKATASSVKMPNGAFFLATAVHLDDPVGSRAKLMRIRNYMTNSDGQPVVGGPLEYAMDMKFEVDAGVAGSIMMLVDPDTGNGVGYEP